MFKNKNSIIFIISIVLLLLWVPVSLDKLIHYQEFKFGILRQPLSYAVAWTLIYSLPILELLTAICIASNRFRLAGFVLSTLLMAAFTTYIGSALLGVWEHLPCSCGSVIRKMSWKQHLWFNIFFLGLSLLGCFLQQNIQRISSSRLATEEGLSAKRPHKKIKPKHHENAKFL